MAPSLESRQPRWQKEAKRGFSGSMPDWTKADDTDHEYDVTIMKKRRLRIRVRRGDSEIPSGEPNIASSLSRRFVTIEQRSSDDSDSESDDDDDSDKEERIESTDGSKLVVPSNDTPTVAAPSADGSVPRGDSGMVSGGDGVHSNVHKVLLGVGIVGGFLLLLAIGFIIWKLYKKRSDQKKRSPIDDMAFEKPSRFENLVSKVPFIGPRFGYQGWYTIDAPSQEHFAKSQQPQGNLEKAQLSQENLEKAQPVSSPRPASSRIDSQLLAPMKPLGAYRLGSTRTSTINLDFEAISPTSTMFVESTAVQVQVIARHDPKESIASVSGRQHKRVPSTTPYIYDVGGRRQTGTSYLSSISSGFGDGDIVVTPTNNTIQTIPSQPAPATLPSRLTTWRSTSTLGRRDTETSSGRRDTVSTEASFDIRPRFHSVNSWVKQQNGHLRRAQRQQESSPDGSTPPVPTLPPPIEQDFGLMMPDGERPRPVEMV
ncbi:uncharacterized protein NECHADRAFT_70309 [Fusarium vanettenii 77-13-4]|uniref:Mid2 domain-containing protein n=1 Tax=Fusarium vanettenii (strain ATCC MYA-4622 / CBS 123669 / FGSC 9596 / NRRL 45880 / 77-13-4) TaxID=660122 RepID=C7Z9I7_FUSV7|nr:uncharacterized protein NECHADRAFT_70309 [Fusarium vanettenii 77-13-4]EEU39512.1 hypothetical protein NECHADRAFT_70309 [Fusarium vanettenii 77-13-4]